MADNTEVWRGPGRRWGLVHSDGPTVPASYTPDDDVNPICGCHKRAQCLGCGTCTNCDDCYCGED